MQEFERKFNAIKLLLLAKTRVAEETFSDAVIANESNVSHSISFESKKTKPRCAFCRNVGHTKDECRKFLTKHNSHEHESGVKKSLTDDGLISNSGFNSKSTSNLVCYGCKRPGYIRSNCPSCSGTTSASLEFSSTEMATSTDAVLAPRSRPILKINILGHNGTGIIDTAAK